MHQKRHSPAEEVIDGSRAEGDDEVTDQAKDGGGHSAFERARTQQSSGNALQDAQGSCAKESINDERCRDVEGAGDEAGHRIVRDDDGFATAILAVLMLSSPTGLAPAFALVTVLRAPHFVSQVIVIFQEESHGDTMLSNLV